MPNSNNLPEQKALFQPATEQLATSQGPYENEPTVTVTIAGRMPSWNDILAMEHWARDKYKTSLHQAFSSALRATAQDSSTKTTYAKSTLLIAADTLDSYVRMIRERRKLRSAKRRLDMANRSLFESKSSTQKPPF